MKHSSASEQPLEYVWQNCDNNDRDVMKIVEYFTDLKLTSTNVERFF